MIQHCGTRVVVAPLEPILSFLDAGRHNGHVTEGFLPLTLFVVSFRVRYLFPTGGSAHLSYNKVECINSTR